MTEIEQDIRSTPDMVRLALGRVAVDGASLLEHMRGLPAVFLGCGSSHGVALAAAALYEAHQGAPAQAIIASDYRPRPGWAHLAISRTGKTTELVEAMRLARGTGAPMVLLVGELESPASRQARAVLPLEFAPEHGVIQTRFITAALVALRQLFGGPADHLALSRLAEAIETTLSSFDPATLADFGHVVFLGRGYRYGLARLGALNLQETALLAPEAHQTLDYRHGPIAAAGPGSLVWSFDPPDDPLSAAVLEDVRKTGAMVRETSEDPLVSLVCAQLVAVQQAARRGLDPAAPRHLSRAVVLPDSTP
jgi:glucosamine--fructose-6-phosphate aminotransferase (isomerizing)